jgi:riboflavin-specific deaminase-like protein
MTFSDDYWQQLLALKSVCDSHNSDYAAIGFSEHGFELYTCLEQSVLKQHEIVLSRSSIVFESHQQITVFNNKLYLNIAHSLPSTTQAYLKLYLPLATVSMHHKNESFIIAHMAQSLDGKVCTNSGTSKWIGNSENLIHAHRIRALVDGVIVGGNTARTEKPSLNVRHVTGPNPARILLCNSSDSLEGLPDIQGMHNFLLCQEECLGQLDKQKLGSVKLDILSYRDSAQEQGLNAALSALRTKNINSILLEGGPQTISAFLRENTLTWLQLHTAPIVFGSGHSFVSLPEISHVDQAIKLDNVLYTQMGDGMVVTGQLVAVDD